EMQTKWWLFLIWAVVDMWKSQTKSTIPHFKWSADLKARNTSEIETLSPTHYNPPSLPTCTLKLHYTIITIIIL
ncbi:hypothetical protein TorRG33x02_000630, partial [Trema orientale]